MELCQSIHESVLFSLPYIKLGMRHDANNTTTIGCLVHVALLIPSDPHKGSRCNQDGTPDESSARGIVVVFAPPQR